MHSFLSRGTAFAVLVFLSIAGQPSYSADEPPIAPIPDPKFKESSRTPVPPIPPIAAPAPIPAPIDAPAPIAAPAPIPVATPSPVLLPAPRVACRVATAADHFTVTQLIDNCGETLPNSGARGRANRKHACAVESKLAEVFATPKTCEDCAAATRVSQIRCDRGDCHVCENSEYVKALIFDLASHSRRVRRASERSLNRCGLRVVEKHVCVHVAVPSVVLY